MSRMKGLYTEAQEEAAEEMREDDKRNGRLSAMVERVIDKGYPADVYLLELQGTLKKVSSSGKS